MSVQREPHRCVSEEVKSWRSTAKKFNDGELLSLGGWAEFRAPLVNNPNNRTYRLYCGIIRREVHSRGLDPI